MSWRPKTKTEITDETREAIFTLAYLAEMESENGDGPGSVAFQQAANALDAFGLALAALTNPDDAAESVDFARQRAVRYVSGD